MNLTIARQALKDFFGYASFRPMQEEVIQAIYDKKDSLVLMPTGGGKSICFQIPAITMPGVCLVISPLIALMKDQVEALVSNGIDARYINSSQSLTEQRAIENDLLSGKIKLLYVSPEKLVSQSFAPLMSRLTVNLIAIDEAHCISAWGHDFRPEYTKMAFLKKNFPTLPIVALTATADKTTRKDIVQQLKFVNPEVFISSFNRPNLSLKVLPAQKRIDRIIEFVKSRPNDAGIIYCMSRKSTESIAQKLKAKNFKAEAYHAGMSSSHRSNVQEDFINDKINIVCATVAFGMGIDKSNVRWVMHYNMPRNIEGYYQEIGRAGRDGVASDTVLFYSYQDVIFWNSMIEESEYREVKIAKLDRMKEFAEALICRRKILLAYFGEHLEENCGNCDVCLNPPKEFDGTIIVQKALSAIFRLARMKKRVGVGMLIDILRGSRRQEIITNEYDKIKTYGAGGNHSNSDWQYFMQQLLNLGFIEIAYDENHVVKVTEAGKSTLLGKQKVGLVKRDIVFARKKEQKAKVSKKSTLGNELFEILRKLRLSIAQKDGKPPYVVFSDASLHDMVKQLPTTDDEFLGVSGVGKAKLASYGYAFMKEIRAFVVVKGKQKASIKKGQTYIATHQMYLQGLTPEQIAEKRDLNPVTIYSHLAYLYEKGEKIEIGKYITKKEILQILEIIKTQEPPYAAKPIFEALNEEMPYFKIRLGIAYFQKNKQ
jgi:ATP-dependent DNA helicase RecQ